MGNLRRMKKQLMKNILHRDDINSGFRTKHSIGQLADYALSTDVKKIPKRKYLGKSDIKVIK